MAQDMEADLKKRSDILDFATFSQILEMDDEEDERDFSKDIVFEFFKQAEATLKSMDEALQDADAALHDRPHSASAPDNLASLSALGHFLKGSSATLGMTKVKDNCEKIQHIGARKTEKGVDIEWGPDSEAESLNKLKTIIKQTKVDFHEVETLLRSFYEDTTA